MLWMALVAVVIPTYNESENIGGILNALSSLAGSAGLNIHVLVVDDNSVDGTVEIVEDFGRRTGFVSILRRPGKLGLGSAYVDGFRWCLRNLGDFAVAVEMDADGSHDPAQLPRLVEPILKGEVDVVIGSRYVKGGAWRGGRLSRRIISRGANLLVRLTVGLRVRDATSGYRAISKKVLEQAFSGERSYETGYIFQVETLYQYYLLGARILEVPISFYERAGGKSKLGPGELVSFAAWCFRQLAGRISGRVI
ncbi:MAG: polyprenol monophosphomannose synthase [Nitrososphaerota archaeon]